MEPNDDFNWRKKGNLLEYIKRYDEAFGIVKNKKKYNFLSYNQKIKEYPENIEGFSMKGHLLGKINKIWWGNGMVQLKKIIWFLSYQKMIDLKPNCIWGFESKGKLLI